MLLLNECVSGFGTVSFSSRVVKQLCAAWEDSLDLARPWNSWKNSLAVAEKLGTFACSVFQTVVYRQTLYCALFLHFFGLQSIRNLFDLAMNFNFEPHCKEVNASAFINTNCAAGQM